VTKPVVQLPEFEVAAATAQVAKRLLEDVGSDGKRWAELLGVLADLPERWRAAVLDSFEGIEGNDLTHAETLREALRKEIERHRAHPDAWWALPSSEVDALEGALRRLQPEDGIERHAWLFAWHPDLARAPGMTREQWEHEVTHLQHRAVREAFEAGGVDGLLELAARAEVSGIVGKTVGEAGLPVDDDSLLDRLMEPSGNHEVGFRVGFSNARFSVHGWEWAERRLMKAGDAWTAKQKADFLSFLPLDDRAHEVLAGLDPRAREMYWTQAGTLRLDRNGDLVKAAKGFLEHHRSYVAAEVLHYGGLGAEPPPKDFVLRVLEVAASSTPPEDMERSHLCYAVAGLIGTLYGAEGVDEDRLARLEWAFYGALRTTARSPVLLHRRLSRDPRFFAELVEAMYKPGAGESENPAEEQASRAEQAYDLLGSWRVLPGSAEDGTPSAEGLRAWLSGARSALDDVDCERRADAFFARILVRSPVGSDGAWPHEAVRDAVEWIASQTMEEHIAIEIINSRGVYSKAFLEGGDQERALARKYEGYADRASARWPRTASLLYEVSGQYERWAQSSDAEAAFREDL